MVTQGKPEGMSQMSVKMSLNLSFSYYRFESCPGLKLKYNDADHSHLSPLYRKHIKQNQKPREEYNIIPPILFKILFVYLSKLKSYDRRTSKNKTRYSKTN